MFNQIPTQERIKEIEENHNRGAIQLNKVVACPRCKDEKTRCVMMNDEKTKLFMECPACKYAWQHKVV